MEAGGAYESHPNLPSFDILGDLRVNLRAFGVAEEVELSSAMLLLRTWPKRSVRPSKVKKSD